MTKLVLVVIVVFAVCWAPIHFVFVFKAVGIYTTKVPEDFKLIVFQILSHVLAYVNRYGWTLDVDGWARARGFYAFLNMSVVANFTDLVGLSSTCG